MTHPTNTYLMLLSQKLGVSYDVVVEIALFMMDRQLRYEDEGRVTAYVLPNKKGEPEGQAMYNAVGIREWLNTQRRKS